MPENRFHAREAAAALLKMAKTTSEQRVAARLIDATADLKDQRFATLFERAIEAAVSGTWRYQEKSGAWSIRAAPKTTPPASPPAD